ncbi:MAG: MBL fold metallo-hydrolase [Candidatus Dormibacteria bacterium]
MRVDLCGVRGSTPAPGSDFARYGGHTSCVAVSRDGAAPSLVLDAGTGLRRLSALLGSAPFRGTILLGHLHWDHTHGLPFFSAGDHPGAEVSIRLPAQGEDPRALLDRFLSPPNFPITIAGLQGAWNCAGIDEGRHTLEGFSVLAREIPHKGGRTFGYRVEGGRSTIAYLSDHSPISLGPGSAGLGPCHEAARELAAGADLLIHDAQYTTEELLGSRRRGFGHSAIDYAIELGREAGARRVLLFHHDFNRTDAELDAIAAACAHREVPVDVAVEGLVVELP